MKEFNFAIQLLLDKKTEETITKFIDILRQEGLVNEQFIKPDYQPHISLAVFKEMDESYARKILPKLGKGSPRLPLDFVTLGIFRGPKKVLYLGPVFSSGLWNIHVKILDLFEKRPEKNWQLYHRDSWVPHCALLIDESWEKLNKALHLAAEFKPDNPVADRILLAGFSEPLICPLEKRL